MIRSAVRCARVAGATVDPAVDVAVQQQLCTAFRGHGGSESRLAHRRPVASTTTLAFAEPSAFGGVSSFSGMLVVAIGVIIDLGLIGNGRGLANR